MNKADTPNDAVIPVEDDEGEETTGPSRATRRRQLKRDKKVFDKMYVVNGRLLTQKAKDKRDRARAKRKAKHR